MKYKNQVIALFISVGRPAASLSGAILMLFAFALAPSNVHAQVPWPMFGQNPQHTGRSPFVGPQTAAFKWTFSPELGYAYALAVGADETVYVNAPSSIYAIAENGSLKWIFPTWPEVAYGIPAINTEGTIFAALDNGEDGNLYALNSNGTLKWLAEIGSATSTSSPVIAPDGTIYIGTLKGEIVAISRNGLRRWRFNIGGQVSSSPAVGIDGTIYVMARILVSAGSNGLYAINPDGTLKWHYPAGFSATSPALGADGTIYVTEEVGGKLHAVNPDGTLKWSVDLQGTLSSPAIGEDGTVYVGSFRHVLSAVNPDGILLWHYGTTNVPGGGLLSGPPSIGADGVIYVTGPVGQTSFGPIGNQVFAINKDGSTKWVALMGGIAVSQPAIGSKGIYVSAAYPGFVNGGAVYAIGSRDSGSPGGESNSGLPTVTSINPASFAQGELVDVTLMGTNFVSGATRIAITGTGVTAGTVNAVSSTTLKATFAISSAATPGRRTITATTAGGASNPIFFTVSCRGSCSLSPTSSIEPYNIANPGIMSFTSAGTSEAASTGYAVIQPRPENSTPSGFAILEFRKDVITPYGPSRVLVSEAGIPASRPILRGRIHAELNASTNTGIAVANAGPSDATVTFHFTDETGQNFDNGQTMIPAGQQIASFLDQAPFNCPKRMTGTFTFSSTVPISVIALRGFTNTRGDFLITTLPILDMSGTPGSAPVLLPQFADGGGWSSSVILVNPTSTAMQGAIQFRDPSGSLAMLTAANVRNHTFDYSIPGNSSFKLVTSGAGSKITSGSISVIPAQNNSVPTALVVLSTHSAGITVSEAAVTSVVGKTFRIFVESSGTAAGATQSGIALANSSGSPLSVQVELFNADGSGGALATSVTLPPSGQVAKFLNEFFTNAVPEVFQGILKISADSSGLAVVGLHTRYNERREFLLSTTSPVSEDTSPRAASVFPHLVDGGGYTTRLVLFTGSGQSSSWAAGNLSVFSQTYAPWPVLRPFQPAAR